jgi:hypothetical protein
MARRKGNSGKHGAPLQNDNVNGGAGVFLLTQQTVSGTASYAVVGQAEFPFRVVDVWAVGTAAGGGGDTLNVENGTDPITNDLDISGADKTVVRAGTIDDAYHKVSKGGSLNVTTASGAVALVYILCARDDS